MATRLDPQQWSVSTPQGTAGWSVGGQSIQGREVKVHSQELGGPQSGTVRSM